MAALVPDELVAAHPAAAEVLPQRHDGGNYPGYWRDLLRQVVAMNSHEPSWTEEDLSTCTVPLLVVAGEDDPFANTDQVMAMKRSVPSCEVLIVNHATHAVHYEHPAFVAERILDFFARH